MSWSVSLTGRAGAVGEVVKDRFAKTQGCPAGSGEEVAKNKFGEIAETLCKSLLKSETVIVIRAGGSAWNDSGKAHSQHAKFEFETLGGEFIA